MTDTIDIVAPILEPVVPVTPAPESETPLEEKQITLTQSALDSLIKARQSASLRKAAIAEAEATRLREVIAGQGADSTELEKVRGELAASKIERDAIAASAAQARKETYISSQIQKQNFVCDGLTLARLTQDELTYDEKTKSFVTADGQSADEYFKVFAQSRPYLVRSDVISGTGQGGSTGTLPPRDPGWEHFVGPTSSARDANILCQTVEGKRRYAEYRRQARAAGAIS